MSRIDRSALRTRQAIGALLGIALLLVATLR